MRQAPILDARPPASPAARGRQRRCRDRAGGAEDIPVVAAAVLAVVVLLFANLEQVTIDLMVAQVTMPAFFVIAVPQR
jgi:hypothetical protein